jgi:hypothetical protein
MDHVLTWFNGAEMVLQSLRVGRPKGTRIQMSNYTIIMRVSTEEKQLILNHRAESSVSRETARKPAKPKIELPYVTPGAKSYSAKNVYCPNCPKPEPKLVLEIVDDARAKKYCPRCNRKITFWRTDTKQGRAMRTEYHRQLRETKISEESEKSDLT